MDMMEKLASRMMEYVQKKLDSAIDSAFHKYCWADYEYQMYSEALLTANVALADTPWHLERFGNEIEIVNN